MERGHHGLAADLTLGAVAGALATLVMGRVSTAVYDQHDRETIRREIRARGGPNTHTIAARKAAGLDLDDDQAEAIGAAMHFGVGASTGAVYGAVRRRVPAPAPVRGLAFGAIVWLLGDEVSNVAAGITPGPSAFPWQTHARGLVAHLAFGLATEGLLWAADLARRQQLPPPASGPLAASTGSASETPRPVSGPPSR